MVRLTFHNCSQHGRRMNLTGNASTTEECVMYKVPVRNTEPSDVDSEEEDEGSEEVEPEHPPRSGFDAGHVDRHPQIDDAVQRHPDILQAPERLYASSERLLSSVRELLADDFGREETEYLHMADPKEKGISLSAFPDTGAEVDAVSKDFVNRHNLSIHQDFSAANVAPPEWPRWNKVKHTCKVCKLVSSSSHCFAF